MQTKADMYHNEIRIVQVTLSDGTEMSLWESPNGDVRIQTIVKSEKTEIIRKSSHIKEIKVIDSEHLRFSHKAK